MSARVSIAVLALGLTLAGPSLASDVGFLYGRVETESGDVYQGQIRWGKEEAFWDDIFNATKEENENLQYVDRKDLKRIRDHQDSDWDFLGIGDHDRDLTHLFAIRFGDLKRLDVRDDDDVIAEFRNGEEMRLRGGSNDVGARVTVVDAKRGRREIRWDRIRTVEFMNTPASLPDKLGEPLYGTVKFGQNEFTGRIQWDNDETLTTDELDGDTRDGDDLSIEFGEITAIKKHRGGSLVTVKGGEELYLTGSNDVNSGNRGVVVVVPGVGTVKVGWDDFDEVRFSAAPSSGKSYAEYGKGGDLNGEVVTRDGRLQGRIIFDLDESRDFELLHGTSGDTEFLIPFRDIATIKPIGKRRSEVALRMGLTVELKESQDVTKDNDGLLVFTGASKPKYVAWQDVSDVRLAAAPRK